MEKSLVEVLSNRKSQKKIILKLQQVCFKRFSLLSDNFTTLRNTQTVATWIREIVKNSEVNIFATISQTSVDATNIRLNVEFRVNGKNRPKILRIRQFSGNNLIFVSLTLSRMNKLLITFIFTLPNKYRCFA